MNIIDLQKRVAEISYKKKLSHIGSCLTALPLLLDIFRHKKPKDIFILSQGHTGLALYVVLEAHHSTEGSKFGIDAEELFDKHGVHPNRDLDNDIYCSAGSLGHGLPIAVGVALADRTRDVYCLISDGECAEGSIWEALMIARREKLDNLKVYLNANGYSAYDRTNVDMLKGMMEAVGIPVSIYLTNPPDVRFLRGLKAHYHTMDKEDYRELLEEINDKA